MSSGLLANLARLYFKRFLIQTYLKDMFSVSYWMKLRVYIFRRYRYISCRVYVHPQKSISVCYRMSWCMCVILFFFFSFVMSHIKTFWFHNMVGIVNRIKFRCDHCFWQETGVCFCGCMLNKLVGIFVGICSSHFRT